MMGYWYVETLVDHLGGDLSKVFGGKLVYPRQVEVHLPGDRKRACNFNCYHCQGSLLDHSLDLIEEDALKVVNELAGKVPYFIYGGTYTEPLLNPYLLDFLRLTKESGSYFGIHTNGSLLKRLEEKQSFLSELCRLATSGRDYLSISLDAGMSESHMLGKGIQANWFDEILEAIRLAVELRGNSDSPAIRVCYLLNRFNSSEGEVRDIIEVMKEIKVTTLRFSIPYDFLGKDFEQVRRYKQVVEVAQDVICTDILEPLVSRSVEDKPCIFYLSPRGQDVDRMDFGHCIYGYYEIVLAADGYVYRCSNTASPTFSKNRLGRVTDDWDAMILANQDPNFVPSSCFEMGARCTRAALEINSAWRQENVDTRLS